MSLLGERKQTMWKNSIAFIAGIAVAGGVAIALPTPVETVEVERVKTVTEYVDRVEYVEVAAPTPEPVTVTEYVEVPVYIEVPTYVEVPVEVPAEVDVNAILADYDWPTDHAFEAAIAGCEADYAGDDAGLSDCINDAIAYHGEYY